MSVLSIKSGQKYNHCNGYTSISKAEVFYYSTRLKFVNEKITGTLLHNGNLSLTSSEQVKAVKKPRKYKEEVIAIEN